MTVARDHLADVNDFFQVWTQIETVLTEALVHFLHKTQKINNYKKA